MTVATACPDPIPPIQCESMSPQLVGRIHLDDHRPSLEISVSDDEGCEQINDTVFREHRVDFSGARDATRRAAGQRMRLVRGVAPDGLVRVDASVDGQLRVGLIPIEFRHVGEDRRLTRGYGTLELGLLGLDRPLVQRASITVASQCIGCLTAADLRWVRQSDTVVATRPISNPLARAYQQTRMIAAVEELRRDELSDDGYEVLYDAVESIFRTEASRKTKRGRPGTLASMLQMLHYEGAQIHRWRAAELPSIIEHSFRSLCGKCKCSTHRRKYYRESHPKALRRHRTRDAERCRRSHSWLAYADAEKRECCARRRDGKPSLTAFNFTWKAVMSAKSARMTKAFVDSIAFATLLTPDGYSLGWRTNGGTKELFVARGNSWFRGNKT